MTYSVAWAKILLPSPSERRHPYPPSHDRASLGRPKVTWGHTGNTREQELDQTLTLHFFTNLEEFQLKLKEVRAKNISV